MKLPPALVVPSHPREDVFIKYDEFGWVMDADKLWEMSVTDYEECLNHMVYLDSRNRIRVDETFVLAATPDQAKALITHILNLSHKMFP